MFFRSTPRVASGGRPRISPPKSRPILSPATEVERLEPRVFLTGVATAGARLSLLSTTGTPAAPVYHYGITLTDIGATGIGTFWFAWVPGGDFLPTAPLAVSSPAGWNESTIAGSPGTSLQWVSPAPQSRLGPGQSLSGFNFSSTDSLQTLAGKSAGGSVPILTSFVYQATPFSDAGFQFVVSEATGVTKVASRTALKASYAASAAGTSVTLTATVASTTAGGATPSGAVMFRDGSTVLKTINVNSAGVASFTTASLKAGAHAITASYAGNSAYLPSSSPVVKVTQPLGTFNAAVSADLAKFSAAFATFSSDTLIDSSDLVSAAAVIKTDDPAQAATIAPLITRLDADVKSAQTVLKSETVKPSKLVLTDESAVAAAELKLTLDSANPPLVAADLAALKQDRIKLQADLLAQLDAAIAVGPPDKTKLAADAAALINAIGSGASASTALKAAVAALVLDRTNFLNKITADLSLLSKIRAALNTDLTAEQSQ